MKKPAIAHGPPLPHIGEEGTSFVDLLARRVANNPQGRLWVYAADGRHQWKTYENLWLRSEELGRGLLGAGLEPRSKVVLLIQDPLEFIAAYWGCLRSGMIAVPLGSHARDAMRSGDCSGLAGQFAGIAHLAILFDDHFSSLSHNPALQQYDQWFLSDLRAGAQPLPDVKQELDDIAIAVPSSGTTGSPKLICLSHRNMIFRNHPRMLRQKESSRLPEYSAQTSMTWFALDSVTGLRAALMQFGEFVYLPPLQLLSQPLALLDAVEEFLPTYLPLTCHLAARILESARQSTTTWKLDSLQTVSFGAEAMVVETISAFSTFLHGMGFRGDILVAYGLSEVSVVTSALFEAETAHQKGASLAQLGGPLPDVEIRIVDSRNQLLEEGQPGEIQLRCPSKMFVGYADDNASLNTVFTSDGWLKTGDIGDLNQGQLSVLGRSREIAIINGKKYSLAEMDRVLSREPGMVDGQLACCVQRTDKEERIWVFVEPRDRKPANVADLVHRLQRCLLTQTGVTQAHYVPLWPEQIPRTANGKIQRSRLLESYLQGELRLLACPAAPLGPQEGRSTDDLTSHVTGIWQQVLGLTEAPTTESSFFDEGGSSIASADLFALLERDLGITLEASKWLTSPSLENLIRLAQQPSDGSGIEPITHHWPMKREIVRKQQAYLSAWSGERNTPDSLVLLHNATGEKTPLAWVFQGDQEFKALGAALGPDQPLFGMRSGHEIMDYREENVQAMALAYTAELEARHPQGPIFIGGNCQGAVIALAIAQHLLRRRRHVPLLILMEWAFPFQSYQEPVLLLFGEQSLEANPYLRYQAPEIAWRRAFSDYRVDFFPGVHGRYFDRPESLAALANLLTQHLNRETAPPPKLLPSSAYQVRLATTEQEQVWPPGTNQSLLVTVSNQSDFDWPAFEYSGLALAGRWLDQKGNVLTLRDGQARLPALAAGDQTTVRLWLVRPQLQQPVQLIVDLVEEGNSWFGRRGCKPMQLTIDWLSQPSDEALITDIATIPGPRATINGPTPLLTRADCQRLIADCPPDRLKPSRVIRNAMGARSTARTSRQIFLNQPEELIRRIQRQVADAIGIPQEHQEPVTLLCYQPGEYFRLHHDNPPNEDEEQYALMEKSGGLRLATAVIGLSEDYKGGTLRFPDLDREIRLTAGQMVWWFNDTPVVRHEVRPVTEGLRYALVVFIRESPYNPDEGRAPVY
jgi:acyl-CoA synthetase (AMP-forming)/AMP-acid ligase II/acyl carrier protein